MVFQGDEDDEDDDDDVSEGSRTSDDDVIDDDDAEMSDDSQASWKPTSSETSSPKTAASPPPSTGRQQRAQPAALPPAAAAPRPLRPASPPSSHTPRKQRRPAAGIMVGQWKWCGVCPGALALGKGNAVVVAMDITLPRQAQRVHRRIVLTDTFGQPVRRRRERANVRSCKHEDIVYLARFRGMSKEQVDAQCRQLLEEKAAGGAAARRRAAAPATCAGPREGLQPNLRVVVHVDEQGRRGEGV